MASNSSSTLEKLKSFVASPCSSQDFEVERLPNEESTELLNQNGQELQYQERTCRKRKSNEPTTSTQCQTGKNINENNEKYRQNDMSIIGFKSIESPIKESASNSSVSSASFELFEPCNPTHFSKSPRKSQLQTSDSGRVPLIEKDNVHFNCEKISKMNSTIQFEQKEQEIDADLLVELATGTFLGDSSYREAVKDVHTGDRQFPGPAGILPRLHTGLDSNPGLANLMRMHKGRDLKKFSVHPLKDDQASSDVSIRNTKTLGQSEFIDNNQLWHRMLSDDKLASEGYHELMINFNIQYIKNSSECSISNESTISKSYLGYITKTPLLIAVVKWINLVTGHQDPTCQLIDNTGCIYGQLSGEIMEQYGSRIQPGTVLVLRNMAILSTSRNVYVNITLTNMIALYWLTPSRENGLCTTPSIYGKRICRVTKEDILKDAKLMEEEAKAEAHAYQVSLQSEKMQPNVYNNRNPISPSSSTSSVPSSIRKPMNNIPNIYNGNPKVYSRNSTPPVPIINRNNINQSPFNYINSPNNFRTPCSNWKPDHSTQLNKPSNKYNSISHINHQNHLGTITKVRPPVPSSLKNSNDISGRFKFNPNSRSSPIRQDRMLNDRNRHDTQTSDDSILLEGLDEDSLFGDF